MDDVLHAVGETLIAGVTVVAFLTHRALRATPSVGLGVDGGNDTIFLRVLQAAGIGGCKVLLVPPPDEKVASGGVAGPPVATLQELRAQLRNNISCTKTLKPSPIQYLHLYTLFIFISRHRHKTRQHGRSSGLKRKLSEGRILRIARQRCASPSTSTT